MMQIYVKNSNQAITLYQKAFNSEIKCNHKNDDGTVGHAELNIYGQILAICEARDAETVTGNIMQFCLHFGEGKEEFVKKAYDVLKEDCMKLTAPITSPGECPWSSCLFGLIDKFGVNWCIYT
jgi:PhnB protein